MDTKDRPGGPGALEHAAAPLEPWVLVAEDDLEMRRLVCRAMRRAGYQVTEAEDGRELVQALVSCVTHKPRSMPALIISDVRMPGCSGLEVLALLRRIDWTTPIILITAFGDPETHTEAQRLGAARVLDKPFDVEDLCSAAQTLVPVS
jgi:CheY-like chemotaxis protein